MIQFLTIRLLFIPHVVFTFYTLPVSLVRSGTIAKPLGIFTVSRYTHRTFAVVQLRLKIVIAKNGNYVQYINLKEKLDFIRIKNNFFLLLFGLILYVHIL